MEKGRVALEGGWRLERIRRMKLYLYIIQIVLAVAITVFLIVIGKGFSLKPFYLPINSFIYFVLLMGLIIGAESFFFRVLEIRLSQSASSKYYMAKKFTRRAIIIIVISVVVVVLLWVPFISQAIEDQLSDTGNVGNVKDFTNKDPLGLTGVDRITIRSIGKTANVYVVSESNYVDNADNMSHLADHRINSNNYYVDVNHPSFSFAFPDTIYGTYYIVVEDLGGTPTQISYTLQKNISSTTLDSVPIFALMFAFIYAFAIVYLSFLRRKHIKGAIYR
jgi:hypothetical protein